MRIARQNQWKGKVEFSGYVEAYYQYDFNQPQDGNRPAFVYSHHRHNEININLAYLKLAYNAPRLRANLAVMLGTYANANLAAEPGLLKNIYEANAGINLSKKKQVWLEGGVFMSHIGFESAVSKDCWTVTRSMQADNMPYFESGVKLTYTSDNGKLLVSGLVLNGWQRIQRQSGNSLPSFGWQVQGKPNDKVLINSSSFIGADKPDSIRQMRYFHDLYVIINATDKFGLALSFDVGMEQKAKGSKQYNYWYTPAIIARYVPISQLTLAARVEYYDDKNGVIIATGTPNGFGTLGYSLNLDYSPVSNALFRVEGKLLHSHSDAIFARKDGSYTQFSPSLAVSFAYSFGFMPAVAKQ
ncbi:MAG: porin [Bacteroidetes bacterium]|nr:porin [Bacteroidota bacterium]